MSISGAINNEWVGADPVSGLFVHGDADDVVAYDSSVSAVDEISRLRRLLDRFGLPAQIIAASTREILNVVEWLDAGAHIVTVVPSILEGMIVHPYTKETVQMFLRDAAKAEALVNVS